MDRKKLAGMATSQWHFPPKKTYNERDYKPLSARDDWDGVVEVLPRLDVDVKPVYRARLREEWQ